MNFKEIKASEMQMQETLQRLICKKVREKNIKKMQRSKIYKYEAVPKLILAS